jgi:hypothetical protein
MYLQKVISQKLGILKVTDEKSRIRICRSVLRIRIPTKMPRIRNNGLNNRRIFYQQLDGDPIIEAVSSAIQRIDVCGC